MYNQQDMKLKYTITLMCICFIAGITIGAAIVIRILPKKNEFGHFRYYDFHEEIDEVSKDPNHPDILEAYQHGDTLCTRPHNENSLLTIF